ncbi:ABC transporter ATP-binding protein [Desulfatitalea alkaliphila]|uniref:ATP-binding cassette domain-containing protein n=1 Tax=Desulfatitalea alkaliphila TaxID=2929485 RepID=A0AA41UKJ2_9BACT|nr:ATP-binding cassette domain-containing protein [Desulfatitalea alkaliphila]MCJ8501492.1 ATP-binding cassette domain-containing protein [Desulfatitalea alkaliphila]
MISDQDRIQSPADIILRVENVVKAYEMRHFSFGGSHKTSPAVDNVTIRINRGEAFGLVGGSGSGKTTLARLILKLERFDAGAIHFEDLNVGKLKGPSLKSFRRKIQMIPQDPYQSLNPYFSIFETVAEPLVIHRIGDDKARRRIVENAMVLSGLTPAADYYDRYPHQLSGGQRQRVAIARAVVLEPQFIIADEPTSMLDASISIAVFKLLHTIKRRHNVTFLFITHDLAAARHFCERIAVMHRGKIIETGATEKIIGNPQAPYTKALIAAQPRFVSFRNIGKESAKK